MHTKSFEGIPIRVFATKASWGRWLKKWHEDHTGLWLRLAKRRSAIVTLSHKEAIEVALCFGWYTDQRLPESDFTWLDALCAQARDGSLDREGEESCVEAC